MKFIKFSFLTSAPSTLNVFKNVSLKSVITPSSFTTMKLSDILSTILCIAIGVTLRNLNFKIASAKKNTVNAKEIGVTYTVIGIILKVPKTFTTIGIRAPNTINIDCLEKNPAFLIEYFSSIPSAIAKTEYVYKICIVE